MKLNPLWKRQTGEYQIGENLYLGKVHIGSVAWNSLLSQSDTKEYKDAHQYVGSCHLPGLTKNRIYDSTVEEVKAHLEKMVINWFNMVIS